MRKPVKKCGTKAAAPAMRENYDFTGGERGKYARVRDDMATRAARGNLADFDRIMASVPDEPPIPGDELPPGYVSPLPRR